MDNSASNKKVTNYCLICGDGFHPRTGRELTNVYCSRYCMGVAERGLNYKTATGPRKKIIVEPRACKTCGSIFKPNVDKRLTAKFCSKDCWSVRPKSPNPTREEITSRLIARCTITESCWNWTGASVRGYGSINIRGRGTLIAPRLSYEVFVGEIPKGLFVCHHCDNPSCINPEHLFIGTSADNTRDMMSKGRHKTQKKT